MQYSLNINSKKARQSMENLVQRAQNLRPAMAAISEALRSSIVRNFEVGGRYDRAGSIMGGSNRWKEVKGNPTPLLKSGMLRDSVHSSHSSDTATVGTSMEYAAAQNFGIEVGERASLMTRKVKKAGGIPARPFMVAQEADIKEAKAEIRAYLMGGL